MKANNVEILRQDSLLSCLDVAQQGMMAATFEYQVRWADGKTSRAFVKVFPQSRELGVLNEVTGYILAKYEGVTVPRKAAIVQVAPEMFPVSFRTDIFPMGFVISAASGDTPKTFYQVCDVKYDAILNIVRDSSITPKVIAFDDWVANPDRNLGNFVVEGRNKIHFIDHSNLPIKINWKPEDLDPVVEVENLLAVILNWDDKLPLERKRVILDHTRNHSEAYEHAKEELLLWWERLIDDADVRQILNDFFEARAESSGSRISKRYGMLPL